MDNCGYGKESVRGTYGFRSVVYDLINKVGIVPPPLKLGAIDFGTSFEPKRIMTRSRALLNQLEANRTSGGSLVLFPHMKGSPFLLSLEVLLAHRLRLYEGCDVMFLACDGLPLCNNFRFTDSPDKAICRHCYWRHSRILAQWELPMMSLSDFILQDRGTLSSSVNSALESVFSLSLKECQHFIYQGLPLGELCEVSVARYLCHDAFEDRSDEAIRAWQNFLAGAILLVNGYERALEILRPHLIVMNNGRFFWYSIIHRMARDLGIRVVSYEQDKGKGKLWYFLENIPAAERDLDHLWEQWKWVTLTPKEEHALSEYLEKRKRGTEFYPNPVENRLAVLQELGITDREPFIILMFTNLTWDSQVIGRRTIFQSMMDWVRFVLKELSNRPVTVVLRIHPAEILPHEHDFTRERVLESLTRDGVEVPSNVHIVPSESQISSYTLLELADAVLVYTSTIGLEAAAQVSVPLIIGGHAVYANKGFGYCPKSKNEFSQLLKRIQELPPPTQAQVELAKRFAYLFWFRWHIPLRLFDATDDFVIERYLINSLADLQPGRNPMLDLVVEGILGKRPLVLPREQLQV